MNETHKITHPAMGKAQISIKFFIKFYTGPFARESKFKMGTEWADSLTDTPHVEIGDNTEQIDAVKHLKITVPETKPPKPSL